MLGMPGAWADDNHEVADHYTTKIGGVPDWPVPNFCVAPDLLDCSLCKGNLYLIAQIYAPVSSKSMVVEERIIYVFGCLAAGCGSNPSSWRVLRVQRSCNTKESNHSNDRVVSLSSSLPASRNDCRENLWGFVSGDEDDGSSDNDIDLEELGKAFSEAASLSTSKKQAPDAHSKLSRVGYKARTTLDKFPALPCFYIYPQEEKISKSCEPSCSKSSPVTVHGSECDADDQTGEEKWDQESYEYDKALNADRTYLKFMKRLDAYPEQCFRYSYNGKPLLATSEDSGPGNCRVCGGLRQYELQLMPPLLYFLQKATGGQNYSLESWNWMTLIVYTCSENCVPQSHEDQSRNEGWVAVEEAAVVQFE